MAPTVCAALYNVRADSTITIQEESESPSADLCLVKECNITIWWGGKMFWLKTQRWVFRVCWIVYEMEFSETPPSCKNVRFHLDIIWRTLGVSIQSEVVMFVSCILGKWNDTEAWECRATTDRSAESWRDHQKGNYHNASLWLCPPSVWGQCNKQEREDAKLCYNQRWACDLLGTEHLWKGDWRRAQIRK